ncbi:MAG TPA: chemotaxis protein CheX [Verrucomicrobiae bacterium]|jgi:chemotaxis protein CheX|nr:chemotaxis protein CheX [Verrucomicrobiae bacterium]
MMSDIGKADLVSVVDEIFGSMAGLELSASPTLIPFDKGRGYIVSAVQIVGDWQGAVRLDIDLELARRACANLVGLEPGDLSTQDIRDAAGELANMTGGSVKAICSPTSRLSLPSVAMGRDFEFTVSQGTVILESSFLHPSGTLTVSVIEKQGSGQA